MKPSNIALYLCFIIVVAFNNIGDHADATVVETCKAISPPNAKITEFCVETLEAVPGEAKADFTQLAIISHNLLLTNVTNLRPKMEELVNSMNRSISIAAEECMEVYYSDGLADDAKFSIDFIKNKNWARAIALMGVASTFVDQCDDSLARIFGASNVPIKKENNDIRNLCWMCSGFLNKLQ